VTNASIVSVADARTWGPARRVRVLCGGRLPDGTPCERKLGQGPPWEYQHELKPGGLWLRFRCDRCGAEYRPAKQPFTIAWMSALHRPGSQRVIRLPLMSST
jgi:hypothetical protein